MVAKRRKKHERMRGSCTHGWGRNRHRGGGSRGGRGKAGHGKRAGQKKPSAWAKDYFGKYGFVPKGPKAEVKAINLKDLEAKLEGWLEAKLASQEADTIVIDLEKAGYNKLLGTGKVSRKLKIMTPSATDGAVEKIKATGGELIIKK